jgi:hypothetical protein
MSLFAPSIKKRFYQIMDVRLQKAQEEHDAKRAEMDEQHEKDLEVIKAAHEHDKEALTQSIVGSLVGPFLKS